METITIQTKGKKYNALIAFLSALEIPFDRNSGEETKLDRRLRQADEQRAKGELIEVDPQDIWKNIP